MRPGVTQDDTVDLDGVRRLPTGAMGNPASQWLGSCIFVTQALPPVLGGMGRSFSQDRLTPGRLLGQLRSSAVAMTPRVTTWTSSAPPHKSRSPPD